MTTCEQKLAFFVLLVVAAGMLAAPVTAAETTSLHIVRFADDGSTKLNELIVNYTWLEANLPVLGDGTTHYYHQGPVFEGDPWNPAEDANILEKDMGAVKGTDLRDICGLAGGMSAGDTVKVKADDGFSKTFPYENVCTPDARQGPIGITWFRDGAYVPDYTDGMKVVFFADDSTNPWGYHVYGNYDMNQTMAEEYRHYYQPGLPATTGLSVKYVADIEIFSNEPAPVVDTLYDGPVTLGTGTFTLTTYDTATDYDVASLTPLGALDAAATEADFIYNVTDFKYESMGILMLDDVGEYTFQKVKDVNGTTIEQWAWSCAVDGVVLDDFGSPGTDGLNIYELADGDEVVFYYGDTKIEGYSRADAIAEIVIAMTVEGGEGDYTLDLIGADTVTLTKADIDEAVACGHVANYTDAYGDLWEGVPLWYFAGVVDDVETGHWTFNSGLAAEGYSVKVTAGDGYSINFPSGDIALSDGYILANTLNGEPLPLLKPNSTKPCWPLQMIGPEVSSGQLVGNIAEIELVGLPEPDAGWELRLEGVVNDTITEADFLWGINGGHATNYTDNQGRVWTGMPLWWLVGGVDDLEMTSHWTFDDALAAANAYTVRVSAADGYNVSFTSSAIARSDGYILAYLMNGTPLSEDYAPLRLVGTNITSGAQKVSHVATISLDGLPGPSGDWTLQLDGPIEYVMGQDEFEAGVACHTATYTDGFGNEYQGIPLWYLMGWVDDRIPHGPDGFNEILARNGYTVIVTAGDGYSKEISSTEIGTDDRFIVANTLNGSPLSTEGDHPPYPLRLVGEGAQGSLSVGNIARIELTDFEEPSELPSVRVVRYAEDRTTILDETTVDYAWMEANLPVWGGENGMRLRFQGPTLDPADLWNPDETLNPDKVDEVVKGTSIADLCDLVGGAPEDAEIELVAVDSFRSTLNATNLYDYQARQGEPILVWWTERQGYVPDYMDGMRNFYAADDGIFGNDDMRTCLDEDYWHYYWSDGIQYPSAAGTSTKYIATIKILPGAREDWTLQLTGAISDSIDRAYFEDGIACSMSGHAVTWDDGAGNVYSGMPLWVLCGWVDDANKHDAGSDPYRDDLALAGYAITVLDYGPDELKGTGDDFSADFNSTLVRRCNDYLVANEINGQPLPADIWPLKLVGDALTSGRQRVSSIDEIILDFGDEPASEPTLAPSGGGGSSSYSFTGTGTVTTSSEGTVLREVTIDAGDDCAMLVFPQGAVATDGSGDPVEDVTIDPIDAGDLPVETGGIFSFAGHAYQCTPAGAEFSPAILLVFTLSEEEWAAFEEQDLVVRYFNEQTGAWEEIPATVDPVTRTVTAEITHFSIFALFAEAGSIADAPVSAPSPASAVPATGEESAGTDTATPAPTQESPVLYAPVLLFMGLGALLVLKKR
jgi:DMSO/TMAO reductase YedYZ molybdopterin-dependent catalytic subunit